MKLSTRGRYGLRACFALASADQALLNSSELSRQTGVSAKYLERLLAMLKRGGIVVGARGASGGYSLAKNAEEISLGEILRCLDELEISDCLTGCSDEYCPNRKIFTRLQNNINALFDNYSLAKLVDDNSCKGVL